MAGNARTLEVIPVVGEVLANVPGYDVVDLLGNRALALDE